MVTLSRYISIICCLKYVIRTGLETIESQSKHCIGQHGLVAAYHIPCIRLTHDVNISSHCLRIWARVQAFEKWNIENQTIRTHTIRNEHCKRSPLGCGVCKLQKRFWFGNLDTQFRNFLSTFNFLMCCTKNKRLKCHACALFLLFLVFVSDCRLPGKEAQIRYIRLYTCKLSFNFASKIRSYSTFNT